MIIPIEQLQRLTELINDRYAEFEIDGSPIFEPVTLGQARIIWGAVEALEEELEETDTGITEEEADDGKYDEAFRLGFEQGARQAVDGKIGIWANGQMGVLRKQEPEPAQVFHLDIANGSLSAATIPDYDPNFNGSTVTHADGAPTTLTEPAQNKNNGGSADLVGAAATSSSQADAMNHAQAFDDDDPDDIDNDVDDGPDDLDIGINGESLNGKPKREMTPARREWLDRRKQHHADASVGRVSLVEPEADRKQKRGELYQPTLKELVAELQRQAMAGVMPTIAQFDRAKPANWGSAGAQCQRHNMSWTQLAEEAELKARKPGWQPNGEQEQSVATI